MLKVTVRTIVMLCALFALVVQASVPSTQEHTVKIDSHKPVQLALLMTPAGGKLVVETGGRPGELSVQYPAESESSISQLENTITLRGQKLSSTYTVTMPSGRLKLEINVNGKRYVIEQGPHSSNHYEFLIK
jgi:hypothetical protein